MKKALFFGFLAVVLCIALYGCAAYHFGRGSRGLPGGYDRIAVPMFVNKTQEVGIETYFTQELRTQFERSRVAKVTSVNDAQLVLKGTIKNVTYAPSVIITSQSTQLLAPTQGLAPYPSPVPAVSPNPTPNPNPLVATATLAKQYTVTLLVHIEARRASDDSAVWISDFTSTSNYQAPLLGTPTSFLGPGKTSSSPLYNDNSRQDTIASMAKNMMAEAHDRLTENF